MSAPQPVVVPDELLAFSLDRMAEAVRRAGHTNWIPPAVAVRSDRLKKAVAGLSRGEALTVALLVAAECDPSVARMIATIQAPVAGARLLAGLAASLFATEDLSVAGLWGSRASRSGLIAWGDEAAPLPERTLFIPPWLAAGLAGFSVLPPGTADLSQPRVILTQATIRAARVHAKALLECDPDHADVLLVRAHCPAEGEAMARAVADEARLAPCVVTDITAQGLAAWVSVMDRLPIVHRETGPGEAIDVPVLDRIAGPIVVVAGPDGQLCSTRRIREWRSTMPTEAERCDLWRAWGLGAKAAAAAAERYRQGAGRIAELGRALAATGAKGTLEDAAAIMKSSRGRMDALARRAEAEVHRADIVLPAELGDSLRRLVERILLRNRLQEGLGPTIAARYKAGVRALFTGDSGTGKTLAVQWLAREAGLPLYRVDLAALTSKWIGETEKNLSQLLDAAEQGDVMLFFDEADSLFGARTEVGDAHDRYANSQTNFLLQRIEDYEGVAILATNSRDRFDPAFVRRFDTVLEFPLPDAPARRLLWDCHLGESHAVSEARLDRLAAAVDLTGGHVRNVVLAAAARARSEERPVESRDLDAAIAEEYAKLGRSVPSIRAG